MSKTPDPHDRLVRSAMANKAIARAFFKRHLPGKLLRVLDISSVKLEDSTYIDSKLHKTVSDMVFGCKYKQRSSSSKAQIVLLIEHQSTAQKLLPFRVYHYLFNMLYHKLKQRPKSQMNNPLPAVYTLVFYNGKQTPYPYSLNLLDCFDDPHDIMNNLFISDVPLVDINQEKDEELIKLKWLGILSLALKYSRNKDVETLLIMMSEILRTIDFSSPESIELFQTVFSYIFNVSNSRNIDKLIEHSYHLPAPARGEFMTVAEQLEARGEARGEAKGISLGIRQKQEDVAISLFQEGADIHFIAKITKLDLDEVQKLLAEFGQDSSID